ncbi:hypothetical protein PEM37_31670 [Streptomyces sp. AD681]|uniref:hypothetical protein n=1 Tax=Streptomyces sp. AD681 TaxID=3019069 RepID=UPI0022F1B643|nr:hypothetical protein [Streptomyces sp. AD681]MDA5146081.1 hypothetical protein [Streptomyces sp. AD681]
MRIAAGPVVTGNEVTPVPRRPRTAIAGPTPARARHGLTALLSLLLVMSAWACGTRAHAHGEVTLAWGRATVTAPVEGNAQEPSAGEEAPGTVDAARPDSPQCETPGSPAPCRKVLPAQPDVNLPAATDKVVPSVALTGAVPRTSSADVRRDAVTSGLSPPTVRTVPDRMRI